MASGKDGLLGGEYDGIPKCVSPFGYWDNVGNWLCMLEAWDQNSERETLLRNLSTAQLNSFRLLHEWWTNDRQDQGLVYREWIVTPDPGSRAIFTQRRFPWLEEPVRPLPIMPNSRYNETLFKLWWIEFGGYLPDKFATRPNQATNKRSVELLRQDAASIAAAHRLANHSFQRLVSLSRNTSSPILGHATPQTLGLDDTIPAYIQACPWLNLTQEKKDWPFYLWDTHRTCTVTIGEVQENATYIVLSHTWGRWLIKDSYAYVHGVPWMVPRNSLFEVENLPNILSRLPGSFRYIWFDLVCIPQDDSLRKKLEIARQAKIFASASKSAIWFNQVNSWEGLQFTIDWLSLKYLDQNNAGGYKVAGLLANAAKNASKSTALVIPSRKDVEGVRMVFPANEHSRRHFLEPVGWFTSLWTLQEACMRPDMWLLDKNWNTLSMSRNQYLSLDHLVALFNASFAIWGKLQGKTRCPKGPFEVAGILTITGLHKLLNMSPIDVLLFGNQRYCMNYRAEAIMSVIGSTSWYSTRTAASSGAVIIDETMVEGKYPFDFVEETRHELGALFFSALNISQFSKKMYELDSKNRLSDTRIRCTMMPFSSFIKAQRTSVIDGLASEDHPSVDSWQLQNDGSVKIPNAGIVASWPGGSPAPNIKANIKATPAGVSFRGECDLREWLGSFRPNAEKHAICLLRKFNQISFGIIVERLYLYRDYESFMKIGIFWFHYDKIEESRGDFYPFPESRNTDWVVI